MALELKSKMSNEKNLEILRNDENSKKIKDLIGRDLKITLVQNNPTDLRILSYLLDKQGHEIDNVDLFKSITGLNCSEAFIKTFTETFIGRFGNDQASGSIGDAICAVNALRKSKTASNADMIRCMEKFCEDKSCTELSKAFNAVKIEDDTGIKLTTKQLDVLVGRFGTLENIAKQINDFKATDANDEMIKASIGILETFPESSSIVPLKDAYKAAINSLEVVVAKKSQEVEKNSLKYDARKENELMEKLKALKPYEAAKKSQEAAKKIQEYDSQRANELMKKLDALGSKKGESLVRPTKPRRTRW